MNSKRKLLICGATGFIGRNCLEHFANDPGYEVHAVWNNAPIPEGWRDDSRVRWIKADLRERADVERAVRGIDVLIQAAATTSGSKEIVGKPYIHVTDNAVMNSFLLRSCFENRVAHVVFFSCTVMYPSGDAAVREEDFNHAITEKYFGVGWTKVYIEKMCEFYAGLGHARHTVIRHSNIFGPHDKFDLERSHVFGATVNKVMSADEKVVVWGEGTEERDLLHVRDLVRFVDLALARQKTPIEIVNVGAGRSISVRELVSMIIRRSGRNLRIEFDRGKPTIPFKLALDISRAKRLFDWEPRVDLALGIDETLRWYRENRLDTAATGG